MPTNPPSSPKLALTFGPPGNGARPLRLSRIVTTFARGDGPGREGPVASWRRRRPEPPDGSRASPRNPAPFRWRGARRLRDPRVRGAANLLYGALTDAGPDAPVQREEAVARSVGLLRAAREPTRSLDPPRARPTCIAKGATRGLMFFSAKLPRPRGGLLQGPMAASNAHRRPLENGISAPTRLRRRPRRDRHRFRPRSPAKRPLGSGTAVSVCFLRRRARPPPFGQGLFVRVDETGRSSL